MISLSLLAQSSLLPDDGSIVAMRVFDVSFAYFDIAFLAIFVGLLIWQKKYMTLLIGFLAGILYTIVDFGVFYAAYNERKILVNGVLQDPGMTFLILLWMSMSYGFTNFTWIWLWIQKDKHLFEWSLLILCWWLCGPMLMSKFTTGTVITTFRTTNSTHGGMAIMFFIGYLFAIMWNLKHKEKDHRINIPWILTMGILVQFGWEAGLLLGGIRSDGRTTSQKMMTMIVNSLIETNLGMPYIYMIFIAYSAKFTEKMKRRPTQMKFLDRLAENNHEKVRSEELTEYFN